MPPVRSFDKWHLSTITVEGTISNLSFEENKLIRQLKILPTDKILCIATNSHVIYHPSDFHKMRIITMRQEKIDKKKARKNPSRGHEFNSSLTIYVQPNMAEEWGKIYIPKLFRTGAFQCQGILTPDYTDFIPVVDIICEFFTRNLQQFDMTYPLTPAIREINSFMHASGERQIEFTRYIGPIRLHNLNHILQNWIYHIKMGDGETINLPLLSERIDTCEHLAALGLAVYEKTYGKGSTNIRILFKNAGGTTYVTTFVTRKGKINMNGLRDNDLVERIHKFYQLFDIRQFIMKRAVTDAERDDLSSDDDESLLWSGTQTPLTF